MWVYIYIVVLLSLIVGVMFLNPKYKKSKGDNKHDNK
jgi:hypothetical protein